MKKIALPLFVLSITISVLALILFHGIKLSPLTWGVFGPINQENNLALKGYDPVSYQIDEQPRVGSSDMGLKVDGVIYRFASDENKLMFKTFPERFVPQYGGYCASAVSSGYTADVDPEQWIVSENRLFLFYNEDAKNGFSEDLKKSIDSADQNWAHR